MVRFDRECEMIGNYADDLMTVINIDYVYEFANDTYCRYHQKEREEIIGNTVAGVWGPDAFETDIRHHLNRCFLGETSQRRGWFHFAGPECGLFEVNYFPYCSDGISVSHAIVITRDVYQKERVARQIQRLKDPAPVPSPKGQPPIQAVAPSLDPLKAQRYWESVLRLVPDHQIALYSLGKCLMSQKKPRAALAVFQRLRRINPRYPHIDDLISAAHDRMIAGSLLVPKGRFYC